MCVMAGRLSVENLDTRVCTLRVSVRAYIRMFLSVDLSARARRGKGQDETILLFFIFPSKCLVSKVTANERPFQRVMNA